MAVAPPHRRRQGELALARELLALAPHLGRLAWRAAGECRVGSPERNRMLLVLGAGPQRAGRLAEKLRISPATVSELVDGLVREGLVLRQPDPDDRRAVLLELTTEGRRQRRHFEEAAAALLGDVVATLSAAKRRRIESALADLRDAFTGASYPGKIVRPQQPKERVHVR